MLSLLVPKEVRPNHSKSHSSPTSYRRRKSQGQDRVESPWQDLVPLLRSSGRHPSIQWQFKGGWPPLQQRIWIFKYGGYYQVTGLWGATRRSGTPHLPAERLMSFQFFQKVISLSLWVHKHSFKEDASHVHVNNWIFCTPCWGFPSQGTMGTSEWAPLNITGWRVSVIPQELSTYRWKNMRSLGPSPSSLTWRIFWSHLFMEKKSVWGCCPWSSRCTSQYWTLLLHRHQNKAWQ